MSPIFVGNRRIYGPESSDPSGLGANDEGSIVYNTTDDVLKAWDGSAWNNVGGSSAAPDGSLNYPAVSAAQLLADYPNSNSGLYYLQTGSASGSGSVQVYCEMERLGGGWVIAAQHQCVDDQGLNESLITGSASGTPNSGSSDFQGAGSLTGSQLWDQYVGIAAEGMLYFREIQTAGGSYDEAHAYVGSTGGNSFSKANWQDLFNSPPANGTYENNIQVIYRNGTRADSNKTQTVWSSPSLVTINNSAVDQNLYYCNGPDGGDSNWSFALMRGGTPYPRLANDANGSNRHNGKTRWGQIGFRSATVNVPSDPFGDMSGVGYFPLDNTFNGKSVGHTQFNGSLTGGSYTANGITFNDSGANGFRIPVRNQGVHGTESLGEWFTGNQDWAISMVFQLDSNPATATNRALIHMANGDDHARPAFWVTGPGRGAGVANKMEWFSSSNGSSWDIARGDTSGTGLGSTTIANGTKYHVVMTRSSSSGLTGYVNKNVDWSDSNTSQHYSGGDYEINIGNWFNFFNGYGFHGSIKNVRFFRKNLSQAEVNQLYALDF